MNPDFRTKRSDNWLSLGQLSNDALDLLERYRPFAIPGEREVTHM